jgi:protein phosphatase
MSALRTGWDLTGTAFKWHFKLTEQEFNELAEMVQVYVQLMHRNLKERALADPRLSGMGSTITAAMTFGLDALIAHAGDSRAYLFRRGTLKRLTRDHTVAQEMVDAGVIPSVAHASQIMQHMLVNCLGGRYRDQVEVDVSRVALENCDVLLLCTDGLTDMISEEELTDLLNRDQPPQEACQACVDLAMDHGGKDNITVVVARFDV